MCDCQVEHWTSGEGGTLLGVMGVVGLGSIDGCPGGEWKAKSMCVWAGNSCGFKLMTTCVVSAWSVDRRDLSLLPDLWMGCGKYPKHLLYPMMRVLTMRSDLFNVMRCFCRDQKLVIMSSEVTNLWYQSIFLTCSDSSDIESDVKHLQQQQLAWHVLTRFLMTWDLEQAHYCYNSRLFFSPFSLFWQRLTEITQWGLHKRNVSTKEWESALFWMCFGGAGTWVFVYSLETNNSLQLYSQPHCNRWDGS